MYVFNLKKQCNIVKQPIFPPAYATLPYLKIHYGMIAATIVPSSSLKPGGHAQRQFFLNLCHRELVSSVKRSYLSVSYCFLFRFITIHYGMIASETAPPS